MYREHIQAFYDCQYRAISILYVTWPLTEGEHTPAIGEIRTEAPSLRSLKRFPLSTSLLEYVDTTTLSNHAKLTVCVCDSYKTFLASSTVNKAVIASLDSRIQQFAQTYLKTCDRKASSYALENLMDQNKRKESLLVCLSWAKRRLWTICMEVLQVPSTATMRARGFIRSTIIASTMVMMVMMVMMAMAGDAWE